MKATRKIRKISRIISLFSGYLLITAVALDAWATGQAVSVQNDSLRIKYYTLEDGLSQVTVNDLLQDHSGFVWIATEGRLNRFDGREFKHFKHSESDSTTIAGNVLNKLAEDPTGKIWIETIGNELNYYDKSV